MKQCNNHVCKNYKFPLSSRCLRGRNGWMSNPNCTQFRTTLRKLLLHNFVKPSKYGNGQVFEDTESGSIFTCQKRKKVVTHMTESSFQLGSEWDDQDVAILMEFTKISGLQSAVISYIAGFICRKMMETLQCQTCCSALVQKENFDHMYSDYCQESLELIWRKDQGGLIVPSKSVISVVQTCEKAFKLLLVDESSLSIQKENHMALKLFLIAERYQNILSSTFQDLEQHDLETSNHGSDFHSRQLRKEISHHYLRLRLYSQAKTLNEEIRGSDCGKRQSLSRLLVFKNL